MSTAVTYPVQVLREHITGLEAAITLCLADPDHKPVHKLRTQTRRIEALLLLLALVPDLPEHRKEASALLRALAKLRRAAGEVRDLDVHRKMLETFAETEDELADPPSANGHKAAGKKTASRNGKNGSKESSAKSGKHAPANAAVLARAAAELRKSMGKERDKAAADLQDLLKTRQAKTALASEALLKVLHPAEELALPAQDLLRDAQSVLTREGFLQNGKAGKLDEDELHTVRKAAKAARYVAESLSEDTALAEAARRFESLQEAGGQWHDALELARAARRHFGKGHELTAAYREERDRKLKAYKAAVTAVAKEHEKKQPRRKPVGASKPRPARKPAAAA